MNVLETLQVNFSKPRRNSGMAVERCIQQRRSTRAFRDRALAEGELGQLLWAAQGTTAADGKRAVPSAGALYPLELYAGCGNVGSLAGGIYRYSPDRHELRLAAAGHHREKLVDAAYGQDWIATAPVVICIAAAFGRTTIKYGNRGRGYVYMEAGHAAESLMLQAVALGLATTMVGAFDDDAVAHLFHLASDETPLCLLPVGAP
jgi:SagB-type dehydrogenase family enzyme